jgi:hypothetical protein
MRKKLDATISVKLSVPAKGKFSPKQVSKSPPAIVGDRLQCDHNASRVTLPNRYHRDFVARGAKKWQ